MRSDLPSKLRIGQFRISREIIWARPEECRLVLKDVIVLKAEFDFSWDSILYEGLHPNFDEQEVRNNVINAVPYYDALMHMDEAGTVTFTRWKKFEESQK